MEDSVQDLWAAIQKLPAASQATATWSQFCSREEAPLTVPHWNCHFGKGHLLSQEVIRPPPGALDLPFMACLSLSLLVMSRAPETCKMSENQSCSGASIFFIFAFFPKDDFCTRPQGLLSFKSILFVSIPFSDLVGWRRVCGSSLCCPPATPCPGVGHIQLREQRTSRAHRDELSRRPQFMRWWTTWPHSWPPAPSRWTPVCSLRAVSPCSLRVNF